MNELEQLKKENEELKKKIASEPEKEMLSVLRKVDIRSGEELASFLQKKEESQTEYEDEDYEDEDYEDEDYEDEDDIEKTKQRIALLEQRERDREYKKNLIEIRTKVRNSILDKKDQFKYLATQASNPLALDNIIQNAAEIYKQTGREPNADELLKSHNEYYKQNFISQAKALNMSPEEFKKQISQDVKKAESDSDKKLEEEKPKESVPENHFQLKTDKQIAEMEEEERGASYKYLYDKAEAERLKYKMIDPVEKSEEPSEPKEEEPEESNEEKSKKIATPSGGVTGGTPHKGEGELTEGGVPVSSIREAGFNA